MLSEAKRFDQFSLGNASNNNQGFFSRDCGIRMTIAQRLKVGFRVISVTRG